MNYERRRWPKVGSGAATLNRRFSFQDTHQMVADITHNFGSFWESECVSMKTQLVQMDPDGDGRVPLSKFYGSALDTEWRFGESETYLRDLGALDETSTWKGKQVIIPNYIQAASNCIVSSAHYLVCCTNECEGILGDIEVAIGRPTATPSEILDVVGNITVQNAALDDKKLPNLKAGSVLTKQLEQMADAQGGEVPLHGRLFAQWLHYVFPQECPFPHKTGTASTATPMEFGNNFIASHDEMHKHAQKVVESSHDTGGNQESAEDEIMAQWDHEEELFADYTGHLKGKSSKGWIFGLLLLVAAAAAVASGAVGSIGSLSKGPKSC